MIFSDNCCPWRSRLSPFPRVPLPHVLSLSRARSRHWGKRENAGKPRGYPTDPPASSCLQLFAAQQLPPCSPWELSCRSDAARCSLCPSPSELGAREFWDIYKPKAIIGRCSHISDPEWGKCNFNELDLVSTHGITPGMFQVTWYSRTTIKRRVWGMDRLTW